MGKGLSGSAHYDEILKYPCTVHCKIVVMTGRVAVGTLRFSLSGSYYGSHAPRSRFHDTAAAHTHTPHAAAAAAAIQSMVVARQSAGRELRSSNSSKGRE